MSAQKRNVGKQAQNLFYGAKAGFNIATLSDIDDDNNWTRIGLCIGAFGEYKIRKDLGLTAELLYSQQGAERKEQDITVGLRLDYLNVPLMVNFYPIENLAIKAGLQPGISLSSKIFVNGVSIDYDDANALDISLPVGVSYQLDLGLKIDLRYNFGLTNIEDDSNNKNRVFQITLGWVF